MQARFQALNAKWINKKILKYRGQIKIFNPAQDAVKIQWKRIKEWPLDSLIPFLISEVSLRFNGAPVVAPGRDAAVLDPAAAPR
jgi:hypothetical protein